MEQTLAERPGRVLEAIIREYIRTAEPVGSFAVADRYQLEASPATIRNDMADLEAGGYIQQPHPSAGRVPTEQAYHYYIAHFLRQQEPPKREVRELVALWAAEYEARELAKLTAKAVASFSAESAFFAFGRHDVYCTGLANLFAQPEFSSRAEAVNIGQIIDHFDEAISRLAEATTNEVQVLIGSDSQMGRGCSVVITRYRMAGNDKGIFGLLGPTRMDYDRNVALVRFVQSRLVEMLSRL